MWASGDMLVEFLADQEGGFAANAAVVLGPEHAASPSAPRHLQFLDVD
ncbi:MAG: hypothetical protein WCC18_21575 [Candidatus Acidiferrales bacterium]